MDFINTISFIGTIVVCLYFIYKRPAHPLAYILLIFSLYFFSSSLGDRRLIFDKSFEIYWYVYWFVCVVSLICGGLIGSRIILKGRIRLRKTEFIYGLYFFIALSVPLLWPYVSGFLNVIVHNGFSYPHFQQARESAHTVGIPYVFVGTASALLWAYLRQWRFIIVIAVLFFGALISGQRGFVVNIMLCFIPILFLGKHNKKLIPIALIFFISLASLYGNARAQLSYGPSYFASFLAAYIVDNPVQFVLPVDTNEFDNVSIMFKKGMHDGLDDYPSPGMNYARGVIGLIPFLGRASTEFGENSGVYLRKKTAPDLMSRGYIGGTGDVIMLGGDAYIAGGVVLSAVMLFFFSLSICTLYKTAKERPESLFYNSIYVLSFPVFILYSQRSTFESTLYHLTKVNLAAVLFVLLFALLMRSISSRVR